MLSELSENSFTCFAVRDSFCRVGFSGSPERPMGVLKGSFFLEQVGL